MSRIRFTTKPFAGVAAGLGLALLLALTIGCSKNPSEQQAAPAQQAEPAPQAAPPAELPPGVPKDAMLVTDITPGKKGGRLIIGQAGDIKTLNPITEDDVPSQHVIGYMQEALSGYDNYRQEVTPALAKSWDYDEPTMTWTFHLRENIKWNDGSPITADDFIFSVECMRDKRVPTDQGNYFQADGKPFEFSAPDTKTLKVKLPVVDSFALLSLSLVRPLPRAKFEAALKEGAFAQAMGNNSRPEDVPCSGPFMLGEYKSGEKVVLKPNPHYYRYDTKGAQLPYLNEFVMLIVDSFDAMAIRFQAGDADLIQEVQNNNVTVLLDGQEKGDYTVHNAGPSLSTNSFWFNLKPGGSYEEGKTRVKWEPPSPGAEPPAEIKAKGFRWYVEPAKLRWFGNEEFRKACSMAANREAIVKTILFGEGQPLFGPTAPGNKRWHNPDIPKFPYDIAQANALLDSIDFKDRDGDGIREDDQGVPMRFAIISNKENNIREKVAVLLKEDLTKLGLDVTVQMIDFNDLVTRTADSFDYEACLLGIGTGVPPHPAMGKNFWISAGRLHQWNPEQTTPATPWEAEIDKLYSDMQATFDEAEQVRIYSRMQDILCEQQPLVHLFTANLYVAASNKVGNLKPSVLRPYLTHNIWELFIK